MNKIHCFIVIIAAVASVFSCRSNSGIKTAIKKIDTRFTDSIIKNSDSTYTKKYKRPDFVTADYYISKKDSTIAQVMRDTTKQIRQVIITRYSIRTYFAQYYENGQIMATLSFDDYGQYHGPAIYYYSNGSIKSSGNYNHGLSTGTWQEFDDAGVVTKLKYDTNGVRIPQ